MIIAQPVMACVLFKEPLRLVYMVANECGFVFTVSQTLTDFLD